MKLLMAVLREFQELCRILSCRNVQSPTSPSSLSKTEEGRLDTVVTNGIEVRTPHTIKSHLPTKTLEHIISMGSKPQKQACSLNSTIDQDHVLNILQDGTNSSKDPTFSPYTPLPAIGNTLEITKTNPKIVRQLTYKVLDPIYVKGPLDIQIYSQRQSARPNNITLEKPRNLQKVRVRNKIHSTEKSKQEINNELDERRRLMREGFSKSVHGNRIKVEQDLIEATEKLKMGKVENTRSAFWFGL